MKTDFFILLFFWSLLMVSLFIPSEACATHEIEMPPFSTKKLVKSEVKPKPTSSQPERPKSSEPKPFAEPVSVQTGVLFGRVISMGEPVRGASVVLNNGKSALTDLNGEYTFADLEPGQYSLVISAPSLNPAMANVIIVSGAKKTLLAVLSPDYMPGRNEQFVPEKRSISTNNKRTETKKVKERGFITVRARAGRDTFDRDENGRPSIWWVKSISVEQLGSGTLQWQKTWSPPGRNYDSRTRELFCSGAPVGDEYRIEVEWQERRSGDSRTRHWNVTTSSSDTTYSYNLDF